LPTIVSVSSALPPNVVLQEVLKAAVADVFSGLVPGMEVRRILDMFDRSRIDRRHFMMPIDWYLTPRTPEERNGVFMDKGLDLLIGASQACLDKAGCGPDQVDHVVFVTTTGLSTPTLDCHLINRLGLSSGTTRLPIWGLGCAAGAAGLARAFDYCLAHPGGRVLVAALETCSLTLLEEDRSKKNLVALSLFSDGCAAALVAGDGAGDGRGPRILSTRSHLYPDSYRVMGWDIVGKGFRLVLSPDLPELVRTAFRPQVDAFLLSRDLRLRDVSHYIMHPGGAKVIDAVREALGLAGGELRIAESVLRDHGNISSASVLLVLERWMAEGGMDEPGFGLLAAFGPGFSAEMALLAV
jgi:alkylresorcinol/alkylpyrone synthase